jgi:hypothetical protein
LRSRSIQRTALRGTVCYDIVVYYYTSSQELAGDTMPVQVPGFQCEDRLREQTDPFACCCLCPGLAAPECSAASLIPLGWAPSDVVAV